MIFADTKTFATVWKAERKDKYTDVRLSTSIKDKKTNEYTNSNWFTRFVGEAHKKCSNLNERDRIIITRFAISNEMYTDGEGNKKSAFKFIVLDYVTNVNDIETDEDTPF